MKTAIRHTSAFALVALLLSQGNPKVFAQSEGNSTVNCDAGGANLQTKLNNASSGATVWVTGTCSQGPYTISKDISLVAFGPNGATLSAPNGRHVLIVQGATLRLEEVQINGGAGAGILVHGGTLFANALSMAAGRASLLEVLTEGVDALCFAPENLPELTDAVRRIVADCAFRRRLGAEAQRTIARRELTWSGNARRSTGGATTG